MHILQCGVTMKFVASGLTAYEFLQPGQTVLCRRSSAAAGPLLQPGNAGDWTHFTHLSLRSCPASTLWLNES
jgi:hypothetical protein